MKREQIYHNRELSLLSFNYRVLQEAKDLSVPLYERIKFLAIYSSNLDEFFRVRVASLRSLLRLKKKTQHQLNFDPADLLKEIYKIVNSQQEEFGRVFRKRLLPELRKNNIYLIDQYDLTYNQKIFIRNYFQEKIQKHIEPILIGKKNNIPFLQNKQLYLAAKLIPKINSKENKGGKNKYVLVNIPTDKMSRFVELPMIGENHFYVFIDDIIRVCLCDFFDNYEISAVHSIKLTRDAQLNIDDEFTGNLLAKIKKGINKRDTGVPSRFLYDSKIPKGILNILKNALNLENEDLVPGGKYHNFNDLFGFPNPGKIDLLNPTANALLSPILESTKNYFEILKEKDVGLHFPYQSYDYVVKFLDQAAEDPAVTTIKITQYRVASDSKIIKALIKAVENGKDVMAFVEAKARFDEENNIQWAEEMQKRGVKVFFSFPGLKVHAKIALVKRIEDGVTKNYCYFGTGNFNEKTASIYSDFGLLTSNKNLTKEACKVFEFLAGKKVKNDFKYLLVAQFNMRKNFVKLIETETANAKQGIKAKIILKMNSLEDKRMINKLYEASRAGVEIDIIVRGICCLIPGIAGLSDNIKVLSIVDKYLEHSRFYIFYNGGDEKIIAASADWMKRNLSRRIEVGFPIYDEDIRKEIKDFIKLQIKDNTKSRIIDKKDLNEYANKKSSKTIRVQTDFRKYLKKKFND